MLERQTEVAGWLQCALLVAATMLVLSPGLHGGFLFDDYSNLLLATSWRVESGTLGEWWRAAFSDISGPIGRPLALLSFALNYRLTGLDPYWMKVTGLGLHCLNGVLVWVLCRSIFASLRAGPQLGPFAAFIVSAAWMLHPLQVSSALYIVQRMELGAQAGVLLALVAYMRARARQIEGREGWPWLLAAAAAILWGMGFKESALLAPGFMLLIEACVFRFAGPGRVSRTWITVYIVALVFALVGYVWIALAAIAPDGLYAIRNFTPTERLLTQLPVLAMYIGQILLPRPDALTFYYDNFPISRDWLSPPATLYAALLLASLVSVAIACWRRYPLVPLGIGWFFVAHALTSNIIPLELAFEHRNYLALLGILLAIAQPLAALGRRLHAEARMCLALVSVLALAMLCVIQAASWGDPLRLAWTLENRNPHSPRAAYDLGVQMMHSADGDHRSPAWSLAREQFHRANQLDPTAALPLQGLILMHGRSDIPVPDDIWHQFRYALTARQLGPESLSALYAVSTCRIAERCKFDDQELLTTFLDVMAANPGSGAAHTLYANFAWNVLHDRELAIRMQRTSVQLAPHYLPFQLALAKFLLASDSSDLRQEGKALFIQLRAQNAHGQLDTGLKELEQLETRGASPMARQPGAQ